MAADEARQRHLSLEVELLGAFTCKLGRAFGIAHINDLVILDRNRLGPRLLLVDGIDPGVGEYIISRGRLGRGRRKETDSEKNRGYNVILH
jgi:hypothetical protein